MNNANSFWARTMPDGACVVWTGFLNRDGYGRLGWEGKSVLAHRLAFFLRLGRWPNSELRHLCNRPDCILHAVEGTRLENARDKISAGTNGSRTGSMKDRCVRGHPYGELNNVTFSDGTRRCCRACRDLSNRARQIKA